ncbi:CRISPR-associated protein, Cas2 [Methanocaldococcus bathoardescens]|uniref:CRISPR-associated endoribonuclease Cas2 n=1 Tax=Methanocaldococcus bathoardescens TaxID=1301915 RepID=A0A076LIE0_9EURY|nr:CRISPR-associated endonuclease Cas2 [Methanocaldococcus bathoardescens]AIJ05284.1 CRISPR-associated protein, Cas2 [Methanocaldococcus bathoardescens]
MYVIVVYDVNVARVNKVKSFLRKHLNWVQNSVFEGEVTKAEFERIKEGILRIIDENEDSVIIYKCPLDFVPKREILGLEKNPIDDII